MKFYFIRHGQASYLSDDYDKLSEIGIIQSQQLGNYLIKENIFFDKVYSGPLKRQIDTERNVRSVFFDQNLILPDRKIHKGLKEHQASRVLNGFLEQLIRNDQKVANWHTAKNHNTEAYYLNSRLIYDYFVEKWMGNEFNSSPHQAFDSFQNVVNISLDEIMNETTHGENVALFSSGGTIATMIANLLKINDHKEIASINSQIYNGSISVLSLENSGFELESFNVFPYQEDRLITKL